MEDEDKTFTASRIISGIFVLLFVWGSLWAGSRGYELYSQNSRLMTASLADTSSSPSPSPTTQTTYPSPTLSPSQSASPTPSTSVTPTPISTQLPTASTQTNATPSPTPTESAGLFQLNLPQTNTSLPSSATPSPTNKAKTQSQNSKVTSSPTPATQTKASQTASDSNTTNNGSAQSGSRTRLPDNSTTVTNTASGSTNPSLTNKELSNKQQTLRIMIGGDVMMDRNVRKLGNKNGYDSLFANIAPLFKQADIVAVNLEGAITTKPSLTLLPDGRTTKEWVFTFAPQVAPALAKSGITVVSLANNHSDNFGLSGLVETRKYLADSKIKWFGDPSNSSTTELVVEKNGFKLAFVGYHAFRPGFDRVLSQVQRLSSNGNFVIVMPHWGDEYAESANATLRAQARLLAANGASAIFGSHPHVILEHIKIGDVPVFFSLGNLLFDQYFSSETMEGNVVQFDLNRSGEKIYVSDIKIYETSTASKATITYDDQPMDF